MLSSYRPKIITLIMVIIALFMVTACNVFEPDTSSTLAETEWHLEAFEDASPPEDQEYSITFDLENKFGGWNDCNYYWGDYEAFTDGSIEFGDVGTSLAGCGIDSWNEKFHRWLQTIDAFDIEGDRLTLSARKGDLIFKRVTEE
ncbi:MAG: META domain-containing protein [Candidatus Halalkalibacterium sp. M3_1C_030]